MLIMHPTTYRYILGRLNEGARPEVKCSVSPYAWATNRGIVQQSELMEPTEEKKVGWALPYDKNDFVQYEESDKEWCEYFNLGRPIMKTVMGPVFEMDESVNYLKLSPEIKEPEFSEFSFFTSEARRSTVFSPQGFVHSSV